MLHNILFAIWFLLAGAYANVAPILSNKIPGFNRWKTPIDGGRKFRGKPILGSHKTWRGLVSGIILGTLVLALQQYAVRHYGWAQNITRSVDFAGLPTLVLGPLFGIGALGGDAIESFFKRQKGVPSGEPWIPFDQLDYIIGSVLVTLPFIILKPVLYIYIFVIWFGVHLLASYFGYVTGLKDRPI